MMETDPPGLAFVVYCISEVSCHRLRHHFISSGLLTRSNKRADQNKQTPRMSCGPAHFQVVATRCGCGGWAGPITSVADQPAGRRPVQSSRVAAPPFAAPPRHGGVDLLQAQSRRDPPPSGKTTCRSYLAAPTPRVLTPSLLTLTLLLRFRSTSRRRSPSASPPPPPTSPRCTPPRPPPPTPS